MLTPTPEMIAAGNEVLEAQKRLDTAMRKWNELTGQQAPIPVAERVRKTRGPRNGKIPTQVLDTINASPLKIFDSAAIVQALGISPVQARTALRNLSDAKKIRRGKRGEFLANMPIVSTLSPNPVMEAVN